MDWIGKKIRIEEKYWFDFKFLNELGILTIKEVGYCKWVVSSDICKECPGFFSFKEDPRHGQFCMGRRGRLIFELIPEGTEVKNTIEKVVKAGRFLRIKRSKEIGGLR